MSFMKAIGSGFLGADPELRTTSSGLNIAEFRIAWDTGYGDNKQTNWITCACFGKTADTAMKYLSKGTFVCVDGELQIDQWDDKSTGQKRTSPKITVHRIHFLPSNTGGSRGGNSGGGGQQQQQWGGGQQQGGGYRPANTGGQAQSAPPQFGGGGGQPAYDAGDDSPPF